MTHEQHLIAYGYEENEIDLINFDREQTQAKWEALTGLYGIDNVWDYRVFREVFDTDEAFFIRGKMVNVVKKELGVTGTLEQTGTILGEPKFYYNFTIEEEI